METKICSKCSIEQPLTEFYKRPKYGLFSECKSCCKQYRKEYLKTNNQKYQKLKQDNKEKYNLVVKKYHFKNKEKIKQYQKKYNKEYYHRNIEKSRWRALLQNVLASTNQTKTSSTYKMLGYNSKQLKEHLDKQGMDWGKHTIDHKVPLTWFKNLTPTPIVNALINLQPLTEEENKIKGNRFCSPIPNSYIKLIKPWIKKQYLSMLIQENDGLFR